MPDLPVENVHDYPRPPALEPVTQSIRIVHRGIVVANSLSAFRVLETHHAPTYYIPPADISVPLRPAAGSSLCEWKGRARYFDVVVGDETVARAAWAYPDPTPSFAAIADFVAFYAGELEACFVGDAQVIAQPGTFYGGWVTANLTGVPKGAPGTEHW